MLTVITPTIRKDRLDIVTKSLQRQTLDDFEWLIGSNFDPEIPWARWIPDNFKGGYWTLNRMYNKLVAEAKGEFIVSWQDSIYIPPNGLDTFLADLLAVPELSIVSGVGDQYKTLDSRGVPSDKVWTDPRRGAKNTNSFYECTFPDVEWNWCILRKKLFEFVGGFDETLDFKGFGMDGYQFNERLNDLDGHFFLDRANESYTYRHGRVDNWDDHNNLTNGEYEKRREDLKKRGIWPRVDNRLVDQLENSEEVKNT
jgi:hypothetical protein